MTSFRRPLLAALAGVSAAALLPACALAQLAPAYATLLQQAQTSAPRFAEAAANIDQAQGLARQAAARPNPSLELTVENFAGTGPLKGLDETETTAAIAQPLELGGKRPARIAAGDAAVFAARAQQTQISAEFAYDLALAYAAAEAAERRLALADEAITRAEDDVRMAQTLVQAGRESDLRAVQAKAGLEAIRAEAEGVRADRAEALAALSALVGQTYGGVSGGLLSHADRSERFTAPDPMATPAYLAAAAQREATARRVRVEETRRRQDVTLSLGVRRLNGPDATALVGGLSLPLGVSDRNRGNIDAAQAELRAADARLMAARLTAEGEARSSVVRATAAQTRLTASRQSEAAADEAYRLTRLGYEGGKVPLSELLAARQNLSAARTQTLNARLERLTAEAALARLQGAVPFGEQ